jgi:hypothetical protein
MQKKNLYIYIYIYINIAYVGYFYSDGIIKYDGFSTPQIDGTISKETLYSSSQRYNISR